MNSFSICISSKAYLDISNCISFVLNVSKEAARELSNDIFSSIDSLSYFPERNPIFSMPKSFPFEIRKQVVNKRYIILYSIDSNSVVVYRVLDSRRNFNYLLN